MARKKTRSYGEGSTYAYKTKSGTKYRWQASFREDPFDEQSALKRLFNAGYATLKDANAEMQKVLIEAKGGTNPSSSKEVFERYSKLWLEKQKLANSTLMG